MIRIQARRGFTLVEMLMVLLIMGLFAGLVSVIARPDERAALHIEARRLAQLLDLASTESRFSGKPIAWTSDGRGYRFWRFREETGWSEIGGDDLLRARTLPREMVISGMRVENMRPQGAMRIEFVPYGSMFSFAVEISMGAERLEVTASSIGDLRVVSSAGGNHDGMAQR